MIKKFFLFCFMLILLAGLVVGLGVYTLYNRLPSVEALRDIRMQMPLRIYSSDGLLMAEYGDQKRTPIRFDEVPDVVVQALLATEDQRFFEHNGVDLRGLMRAAIHVIVEGNKGQGGSTITMQVARNFFLTRQKTYSRKLNEILLAMKIERDLSKNEILELYLNKVFFGHRAYGIVAAAEVYYGKSLDELTLPEAAMLAGLPKAPSAINPLTNLKAGLERRNYVLQRMLETGYINQATYAAAIKAKDTASEHNTIISLQAPYIAEMVRQDLIQHIGDEAYTRGYQVYTTIDSRLQKASNQAVREGAFAYDERWGFRKPAHVANKSEWSAALSKMSISMDLIPGVVQAVHEKSISVQLKNGSTITVHWEGLSWAKRSVGQLRFSGAPQQARDIVAVGDLIYVRQYPDKQWRLAQHPEVQAALVSLRSTDGAILALTGGTDYYQSPFNRVTQANLQPGSNFKPFIYAAALDKGFTTASIINDAPIVLHDPSLSGLWRPQNEDLEFAGPTRLRVGLVQSRNLVSIRILQQIGIPYTIEYLQKFGFDPKKLPRGLSLALGTAELSPLAMARGFATFSNGGFRVEPYYIDKITTIDGNVIFKATPAIACDWCASDPSVAVATPMAPRVISPQTAYLMNDLLQDVVKMGTGRGALILERTDLAGKTGTTNDQVDAWFSGFNGDVTTTVWVGFDTPHSLGEYGAKAALPIWIDFMREALADKPMHMMERPEGLVTVLIDPSTGLLARDGQPNAIEEIFREGEEPQSTAPMPVEASPYGGPPQPSQPEQIF